MKKFLKVDNLLITILIFFIMWLFSILPYKLVFLDPISKALGDLDLTDIVFSKLREEPKQDTNIVIINIGELNRLEIANQIKVINSHSPRVVGLDITFGKRLNGFVDSILTKNLNEVDNLVLAGSLLDYNSEYDHYEKFRTNDFLKLDDAVFGFVNFPTKLGRFSSTIREFAPKAYNKNKLVYSFATQIASRYNPNLGYELNMRNNEREIINYRGNIDKFYVLEHDFVDYPFEKLTFLKDKIVMLGYLGTRIDLKSFNDIYFTPLNSQYAGRTAPDMYGVVIHANIVSMILNNSYMIKVPQWVSALLAFIICFFNVAIIRLIWSQLTDYYGGLAKVVIFLQTVLLIFITIQSFRYYSIRISFSIALIAIILTPSSVLLYDKLVKPVFFKVFKKQKKITK